MQIWLIFVAVEMFISLDRMDGAVRGSEGVESIKKVKK
jgi:hypothetical protein